MLFHYLPQVLLIKVYHAERKGSEKDLIDVFPDALPSNTHYNPCNVFVFVCVAALKLPHGKTTVMHLVARETLPEPNSQGNHF